MTLICKQDKNVVFPSSSSPELCWPPELIYNPVKLIVHHKPNHHLWAAPILICTYAYLHNNICYQSQILPEWPNDVWWQWWMYQDIYSGYINIHPDWLELQFNCYAMMLCHTKQNFSHEADQCETCLWIKKIDTPSEMTKVFWCWKTVEHNVLPVKRMWTIDVKWNWQQNQIISTLSLWKQRKGAVLLLSTRW